MALAEGRWAWWNQYGSAPIDRCVERAKAARLRGVIVKWGYPQAREAFVRGGVPWATERYVYPEQPELEAQRLAEDVSAGARFAVINAEVEWERLGPEPVRRLLAEFRRLQPRAELYACVDTRGGRNDLPYQRALAEQIAGWMPMVYPDAFGQTAGEAFAAALDHASFGAIPVLPAIQSYGNVGASMVREQIAEAKRRGLRGYQAYTIAHATDEEWPVLEKEAGMEAIEEVRRLQAAAGLFFQAASHALRGERLPAQLARQIKFIMGGT